MNNTNINIAYDVDNCIINVVKVQDLQVYLEPTLFGGIRLCVCYNLMNIINWCTGKDLELLNRCLRIVVWYLFNEYDDLYDGKKMPFCSIKKPIDKDERFMCKLLDLESKIPDDYKTVEITEEQIREVVQLIRSNLLQG